MHMLQPPQTVELGSGQEWDAQKQLPAAGYVATRARCELFHPDSILRAARTRTKIMADSVVSFKWVIP